MKPHLEELLSGYIDEQLTADERARVEQHLAECAACRAELDALRELKTAVREARLTQTMDVTPEFFWSQVRRHIEQEETRAAAETAAEGGIGSARLWHRLAFAGIAALVVIGIGIALFREAPTQTAAFVEVDEARTSVPGGEVIVAVIGDQTVAQLPAYGVEISDVRTEAPNVEVTTYDSPLTGDSVIWLKGLKDEEDDPPGM
jgi:anti-sigma factor RsiW